MGYWADYDAWNRGIADAVFTKDLGGQPIYLDLEEEPLREIADAVEPDCPNPTGRLVEVVRRTFDASTGPTGVFETHWARLQNWWNSDSIEAPPVLGVLAVLSLAAESMSDGGGLSANNYYGRLAALLELSDVEARRFESAYRSFVDGSAMSEWLWTSLNVWLERLEGNRGLPTARADGHTHIGFPISQAMVRDVDRQRFPNMFSVFGLAPGSVMHPDEMEVLFGEWIQREPCPISRGLRKAWLIDESSQARIAEHLCSALSAWDGSGVTERSSSSNSISGTGALRVGVTVSSFPYPHAEVGLLLARSAASATETFDVLDDDGTVLDSVVLRSLTAGWMAAPGMSAENSGDFLLAHAILRPSGEAETIERKARRFIPLRRDPILMTYVEVERAGLGEDMTLLCLEELWPKAEELLAMAARPGYRVANNLEGVPSGWVLVGGVQILSSIPDEAFSTRPLDLRSLQPISRSQIAIEGGLKLPGNISKFSSFAAPELRITSAEASEIKVTLTSKLALTEPEPEPRIVESDQAVLIWDFAEALLPDGDYDLTIEESGGQIQNRTLRLRSADNPALQLDEIPLLIPNPTSFPLAALGATAEVEEDIGFKVAPSTTLRVDAVPMEEPITPRWWKARQEKHDNRKVEYGVHFPAPDPSSCVVLGNHHMSIEAVSSGATTVAGVCKKCGLVKRYPVRPRRASTRSRPTGHRPAPTISVTGLSAVRDERAVNWNVGLDAACHVGQGPISALDSIANRMEQSSSFADFFKRSLEIVGHIEIGRDPNSLRAATWQMNPPTFIQLTDDSFAWVGFRSQVLQALVKGVCLEMGIEFSVRHRESCWSDLRLNAASLDQVRELANMLSELSGKGVKVVEHAGEALIAVLPSLSDVINELPLTTGISGKSTEIWNTDTARFQPAPDASAPGAYRISDFGSSYFYRRHEDVGQARALVADARLVKHVAALKAGRSLIGYDPGEQVLYVPLGAELPGLYARAAALACGRPPIENLEERITEYRMVTPGLAGAIMQKIGE